MQINEIVAEMQKHNLNQADICRDLFFNKGDLSAYLSETKPLPKSRAKAFEWYFKAKNQEINERKLLDRCQAELRSNYKKLGYLTSNVLMQIYNRIEEIN